LETIKTKNPKRELPSRDPRGRFIQQYNSASGRRNCKCCTRWRPVTDFSPHLWNEGKIKYIHSYCNLCRTKRNKKQYYEDYENWERIERRRRIWRKASRKRSGLSGSGKSRYRQILLKSLQQQAIKKHELGTPWMVMESRVGWSGNSSKIQRALGLKSYIDRNGNKAYIKSISYEKALILCEAINIDHSEINL